MGSRVEIDFDARPEWVDQPDRDLGEVHQISIAAGPYRQQRNARKELYKQLKIATDEYINEVVGHPHAAAGSATTRTRSGIALSLQITFLTKKSSPPRSA